MNKSKTLEELVLERDIKKKDIEQLDSDIAKKKVSLKLSDYDIGELCAKNGEVNIAYGKYKTADDELQTIYKEKMSEIHRLHIAYSTTLGEFKKICNDIGKNYELDGCDIQQYIYNFKLE